LDLQLKNVPWNCFKEAITLIGRVSGDRVRHELDHIIDEEHYMQMFSRLDELDLLAAIHPGLKWDELLNERMAVLSEGEPTPPWRDYLEVDENSLRRSLGYILWIIHQPSNIVRAVIHRLKFTGSQIDYILASVSLWRKVTDLKGRSPSEIVSKLDEIPPLAIYANYLVNQDEEIVNLLEQYTLKWRLVSPTIDGHDLREKGIQPGPVYKYILKSLRDAWLDGEIASREEEKSLLESLLSKHMDENQR
jgi:tRNA nucleotidyltransferase (CCA-adding enzyme)